MVHDKKKDNYIIVYIKFNAYLFIDFFPSKVCKLQVIN